MKAIIWFVIISTVIASCTAAATPPSTSTPISTSTFTLIVKTSTPSAIPSITSSFDATDTQIPTTTTKITSTETPTQVQPTPESTPTLEPTPTPTEVIIHPETGLTQKDVDRLADMLPCEECLETGHWMTGGAMDTNIFLISTGEAITREVKSTNGEIIGYFDVVVFVVKDSTGNGRIVEVPQQAVRVDQLDTNIFLNSVDYALENFDKFYDTTRYSLERISEAFPACKFSKYGFSSYACYPEAKPEIKEMCETFYSNSDYLERLQSYVNTGEILGQDPLLIIIEAIHKP